LIDQPAEWVDWAFAYQSVKAEAEPRQQQQAPPGMAPQQQQTGRRPFRGLG
jgi:hypothetical protein